MNKHTTPRRSKTATSNDELKTPRIKAAISHPVTEKLQKVLARVGLGSRREIEDWISAGRVSVDGQTSNLGDRVSLSAKIRVDGNLIDNRMLLPKSRVILYHKPTGEICTQKDPDNRNSVFDHLPRIRLGRWVMVGRLDFNTSGVLLFTTDGELAAKLMHPRHGIEREYAVRILGEMPEESLQRLAEGVHLEDGFAKFDRIEFAGGAGANRWYHVILREGKNREVRRMFESEGLTVSRLIRVRYGHLTLPRLLPPGRYNELSPEEVYQLIQSVENEGELQSQLMENKKSRRSDGDKPMRSERSPQSRSRSTEGFDDSSRSTRARRDDDRPRRESSFGDSRPRSSEGRPPRREGNFAGDSRPRSSEGRPPRREGNFAGDSRPRSSEGRPPRREGNFAGDSRPRSSEGRPPRREGNFAGDSRPRSSEGRPPRREGGFAGDSRPRSSEGRPPRREGNFAGDSRPRSLEGRPPRREGGFGDSRPRSSEGRPPRREGGFAGDSRPRSSEGRPPRREGGFGDSRPRSSEGRPPRREGGFGDSRPRSSEGRPPRREGGFAGDSRPRSSEGRPPRREGGFAGDSRPRSSEGRPPRREGGFGDSRSRSSEGRPPRREGGFAGDSRSRSGEGRPRREGDNRGNTRFAESDRSSRSRSEGAGNRSTRGSEGGRFSDSRRSDRSERGSRSSDTRFAGASKGSADQVRKSPRTRSSDEAPRSTRRKKED